MTINVVSLFTGAGGLDYGFEKAGFTTKIALEHDSYCVETLRANTNWLVPDDGNVLRWNGGRICKEAGLKKGDVNVLVGGPPCQPYSKAGYWHTGDSLRLRDHRSSTLDGFLSIATDLTPDVVVIENVPGIAFSGKDEALNRIIRSFRRINRARGTRYCVSYRVLDAADFGVPQHRRRLFLVALRNGAEFVFPEASHGEGLKPLVTCWDAFGGLPPEDAANLEVTGKWRDLLASIPEGSNYSWHTEHGGGIPIFGWRTRYWSFLLKLARNLPSWTIAASPGSSTGPFHWENRKLSVGELKRLQTFPDGVNFECSYRHAQRMLGNAVPSLMAEVLARAISKQVFKTRIDGTPLLAVAKRRVPTNVLGVEPAPVRFQALRGKAPPPAHAGEGRGPNALKRRSSGAAR